MLQQGGLTRKRRALEQAEAEWMGIRFLQVTERCLLPGIAYEYERSPMRAERLFLQAGSA